MKNPKRPKPDPSTPTYGEHKKHRSGTALKKKDKKNTAALVLNNSISKITDFFQSLSPPPALSASTPSGSSTPKPSPSPRPSPRDPRLKTYPSTKPTVDPPTTSLRIPNKVPVPKVHHPNQTGIDSCQKMIDKTNMDLADLYVQKTEIRNQQQCMPDAAAIMKQHWENKLGFLNSRIQQCEDERSQHYNILSLLYPSL